VSSIFSTTHVSGDGPLASTVIVGLGLFSLIGIQVTYKSLYGAVVNSARPVGLLRTSVSPMHAAVKAYPKFTYGLYTMVVGTTDATNTESGASMSFSCVPRKYRFDGIFVVSQTNEFVPVPVTPTE
jgi:hypothetical protein